ncbi:MAG: STAS domain-containing protein [Candidatus Omnitrophota bacterium]
MKIRSDNKGGIPILRIEGDVDMGTSPEMKKYFDKVTAARPKEIIANLEKVDYMDSSGLATMVEVYKVMKQNEGIIKLVGLSDKVRGLFEITKLDKLFKIFKSEDEALNG